MSKRIVVGLAAVVATAGAMLFSADASARPQVFVHGRNSGPANTTDYWHNGGFSDNGVTAAAGANSAYVYAYDATKAFDDTSSTGPLCSLTNQMYATPGTDMTVYTHSAGGVVAAFMLTAAQKGTPTSCAHTPAAARSWTTYVVTVAAPFRGSELANAVYGQTGGNFLQQACGTIAGSLANLLFNQASPMTNTLRTGYLQSSAGWNEISGYSFLSLYQNWGTYAGGDDATAMSGAAWCAGMPSTNDGVVATYSASYAMPNTHLAYHDNVGHSSNRRDDYGYYAEWVRYTTPAY